jgi:hypothetical protein
MPHRFIAIFIVVFLAKSPLEASGSDGHQDVLLVTRSGAVQQHRLADTNVSLRDSIPSNIERVQAVSDDAWLIITDASVYHYEVRSGRKQWIAPVSRYLAVSSDGAIAAISVLDEDPNWVLPPGSSTRKTDTRSIRAVYWASGQCEHLVGVDGHVRIQNGGWDLGQLPSGAEEGVWLHSVVDGVALVYSPSKDRRPFSRTPWMVDLKTKQWMPMSDVRYVTNDSLIVQHNIIIVNERRFVADPAGATTGISGTLSATGRHLVYSAGTATPTAIIKYPHASDSAVVGIMNEHCVLVRRDKELLKRDLRAPVEDKVLIKSTDVREVVWAAALSGDRSFNTARLNVRLWVNPTGETNLMTQE